MSSAASLILLLAATIAAVGSLVVWAALKGPARLLQRRRQNEALAAAARYTPAERASPYGKPDPCAAGLSDAERVEAMRALLLRGDRRGANAIELDGAAPTFSDSRDAPMTTSPMAWKPTLPPDEADLRRPASDPRRGGPDHQHITVF
jgi:hypothetical protein